MSLARFFTRARLSFAMAWLCVWLAGCTGFLKQAPAGNAEGIQGAVPTPTDSVLASLIIRCNQQSVRGLVQFTCHLYSVGSDGTDSILSTVPGNVSVSWGLPTSTGGTPVQVLSCTVAAGGASETCQISAPGSDVPELQVSAVVTDQSSGQQGTLTNSTGGIATPTPSVPGPVNLVDSAGPSGPTSGNGGTSDGMGAGTATTPTPSPTPSPTIAPVATPTPTPSTWPSIAGTWVAGSGFAFPITQSGSHFSVYWQGVRYDGYFTSPTRVLIPGNGTTAVLDATQNVFTWSNGTIYTRQTTAFTAPNIATTWTEGTNSVAIVQSGNSFTLVMNGQSNSGYFLTPTQLFLPSNANAGTLNAAQNRIQWSNGNVFFLAGSIGGTWISGTLTFPITQSAGDFQIDWRGTKFNGYFTAPSSIYLPANGTSATLDETGTILTWSNGVVYHR